MARCLSFICISHRSSRPGLSEMACDNSRAQPPLRKCGEASAGVREWSDASSVRKWLSPWPLWLSTERQCVQRAYLERLDCRCIAARHCRCCADCSLPLLLSLLLLLLLVSLPSLFLRSPRLLALLLCRRPFRPSLYHKIRAVIFSLRGSRPDCVRAHAPDINPPSVRALDARTRHYPSWQLSAIDGARLT